MGLFIVFDAKGLSFGIFLGSIMAFREPLKLEGRTTTYTSEQ